MRVGQVERREAAVCERVFRNALQGAVLADGDACKRRAAAERLALQVGKAVGQRGALKTGAAVEHRARCVGIVLIPRIRRDAQRGDAVGDDDGLEGGALAECPVIDGGQRAAAVRAGGKRDAFQVLRAVEGAFADGDDRFGNSDALERRRHVVGRSESVCANALQPRVEHDLLEVDILIERIVHDLARGGKQRVRRCRIAAGVVEQSAVAVRVIDGAARTVLMEVAVAVLQREGGERRHRLHERKEGFLVKARGDGDGLDGAVGRTPRADGSDVFGEGDVRIARTAREYA